MMTNSSKPPAFIPAKGFEKLVKDLNQGFRDLEFKLQKMVAEDVRRFGKMINSHILRNKDRADYGGNLFEELERRTGKSAGSLRKMSKFARLFPILTPASKLSWAHYRDLIGVSDEKERKLIEQKAIREDWNTKDLKQYLSRRYHAKEFERLKDSTGPIPQLKVERGMLYTYQIVERPTIKDEGRSLLDLGFYYWRYFPALSKYSPGTIVGSFKDADGNYSLRKSEKTKADLYTFKAAVQRVVDGDTLWVEVDLGFDSWHFQELRLRGIDCPEMDTEEGKRAKTFVLARLKDCEFIVIKTYKDDKYKRMLADIFYLPDEKDPAKVAEKGTFLNQELLDNRLAVAWRRD